MGSRHLLHVRSDQTVNGKAKLPSADTINYGEIAINYCTNQETISLKNSSNKIVYFTIPDIFMKSSGGTIEKTVCIGPNSAITLSDTGEIRANGSIYSSDVRLKDNISDINNEDIEKASKIEFKQYHFKNDKDKTLRYGVIAQNIETLGLNNLISEGEDYKGVNYVDLLILKVAQLEKEIKDLKEKNNLV